MLYGDRLERPDLAARAWNEVLARDPKNVFVLDALARLHRKTSSFKELSVVMRRQLALETNLTAQINLLYELATSDPAFDDFTMVGRSPELRDRSHELGRRIREAINLCASYAEAYYAGGAGMATARQAVRTAMETLVEVERLHWTEQERAEAILEAAT